MPWTDRQTFSDESFKIEDPRGLIVLGQMPAWVELRWHAELTTRCGPDLKWRKVERQWPTLSHELRKAALRDIRDALITIVDASFYRRELEQAVTDVAGMPQAAWPRPFKSWFRSHSDKYELQSILLDSPAQHIQDFLEDDGLSLGDVGGIPGNLDESRTVFSDLEQTLRLIPRIT